MAGPMVHAVLVTALLWSNAAAQQFVMYSPTVDDTSIQRIDPIIAPGGLSGHAHHFFGANKLSPTLDYDELQSSTCTTVGSAGFQGNAVDHSIYWHPALYMESSDESEGYIRVPIKGHKLYYIDVGTGEKAEPFEFPKGFRMISGDPYARSSTGSNAIDWKCNNGGSTNVGDSGGFPTGVSTCSDYPYFFGTVSFPHCWNGDDYDPSNPSAHMAYAEGDPKGGACPSSHPRRLPHLLIENFFDIDAVADKVKPDSFVLAQGDNTGFGMHQDFFNGWEEGALPDLLSTCPQPKFGNDDVGSCSNFKSSGSAESCSLPVQYKENVDSPGKFLPGCNPISDSNPAPQMAVAPLGSATDSCAPGGGGDGSPSEGSPPASSSAAPVASSAPAYESPGTTAATTNEATPLTTGEATQIATGETTPLTTEETTAMTTGETTPLTTEETTPLSTGETMPITTEETAPFTTAETTPITTGDTTPLTTGDTTPITAEETTPYETFPTEYPTAATTPDPYASPTAELTTLVTVFATASPIYSPPVEAPTSVRLRHRRHARRHARPDGSWSG
ncbi:uncharacterized protein LTR77_001258 [Saxophila tyrrhenica]|uniref:DUF1996 domain-containing protein n=1 Tax=Saxophila tyrrhenica TaxID=1690608 RepID=A0AAV9PK03_9PEZI|nr:hypothetical protein LTR77_001258 [Saxophila tyrrhenica]